MYRPVPALIVLMLFCLSPALGAQTGRASGIVRDSGGRPVRGATIRAIHPDVDHHVISTSDSRGRWAMLGLRIDQYTFVVSAPGFLPAQAAAAVRSGSMQPIAITLQPEPGPPPGSLPANIQAQIVAAAIMRDDGRLDQAIEAFETIRSRNPKLTAVDFVIADAYRRKAGGEPDPGAKRAALALAVDGYNRILLADPSNERAKAELASVSAEMAALQR